MPIDFSEHKVHRIVFEDPSLMGKMIWELSNQTAGLDGRFFLSESGKELDIRKKVELIINPFSIDPDFDTTCKLECDFLETLGNQNKGCSRLPIYVS